LPRGTLELPRTGGAPLEEDATRACLEVFCLGETVAVRLFKELRTACEVPVARRVLDRVLRDEVRHRDFGWTLLGWLLSLPAQGARLRTLVEGELPASLARIEAMYTPASGTSGTVPSPGDARWGLMPTARYAHVVRATLDRDCTSRFARLGIDVRQRAPT
jgi:hypothetical protein